MVVVFKNKCTAVQCRSRCHYVTMSSSISCIGQRQRKVEPLDFEAVAAVLNPMQSMQDLGRDPGDHEEQSRPFPLH